jgi:hypothetical protein
MQGFNGRSGGSRHPSGADLGLGLTTRTRES